MEKLGASVKLSRVFPINFEQVLLVPRNESQLRASIASAEADRCGNCSSAGNVRNGNPVENFKRVPHKFPCRRF
jgi:hypothetical protein